MQEIKVSKISGVVMDFFGHVTEQADQQAGFVKRKSKLTAKRFVEALRMGCLSDSEVSLEKICELLKKRGVKMTKQGLHQRFHREAACFMETLFQKAVLHFQTEKQEVLTLLKPFSGVYLTDSTGISLPSELKDHYKGYGGASSAAGIKLQTTLEYMRGQLRAMTVTSATQNDQSFRGHLEAIEKNGLYLQDQGYFKVSSFAKFQQEGAYFISRYLSPTYLLDAASQPLVLREMLRNAGPVFEAQVQLGKQEKLSVRLLATRLPPETREQRIRKIKRDAQRQRTTPSKATLEMAGWSIYITNISEPLLTHAQVYLLYSLRWQIELFFKLCKSEAGIDKVKGKNISRILCELYAKLINVLELLYLCFPVRWHTEQREISLQKAYQTLRLKSRELFHALTSAYRLRRFLTDFLSDLKDFAMKDRRCKKKRATYQKMMDSTQQERFA